MNTKERGDSAVGFGISHFLSDGYEVCLPIGDKRHYDFLIEKDGKVHKVQVKYAGLLKSRDKCLAGLRITGGNQSYNYSKKYGDKDFDLLFVRTERGESYCIPWSSISCRNELSVESYKYKRYKVH